jgi:ribosomal protein S18 acetylase RimI-like enzyme
MYLIEPKTNTHMAIIVRQVNIGTFEIASAIHQIQMVAYAQEAALLGVPSLPPMQISVSQLQASRGSFYAAYLNAKLVGAIACEDQPHVNALMIDSLVVHPDYQRRNIASQLLLHALEESSAQLVRVSTGAKNEPAVALYKKHGFIAYKNWWPKEMDLELIALRLERPVRGGALQIPRANT